jgi:hypothetical protein
MDSETFATLKAYFHLADQLAEHATKEQLAECRSRAQTALVRRASPGGAVTLAQGDA